MYFTKNLTKDIKMKNFKIEVKDLNPERYTNIKKILHDKYLARISEIKILSYINQTIEVTEEKRETLIKEEKKFFKQCLDNLNKIFEVKSYGKETILFHIKFTKNNQAMIRYCGKRYNTSGYGYDKTSSILSHFLHNVEMLQKDLLDTQEEKLRNNESLDNVKINFAYGKVGFSGGRGLGVIEKEVNVFGTWVLEKMYNGDDFDVYKLFKK